MATNVLLISRLTLTLALALVSLRGAACMTHAIQRGLRLTAESPLSAATFKQSKEGFGRCVSICLQNPACRSVNVQWDSAASSVTCEFLGVYLHEVKGALTPAAGWVFIQEEHAYVLGYPWVLAFRVTTGNGLNVMDTWNQDSRHDDVDEAGSCLLPATTYPACQAHFRSFIMDYWTNVDKVRITVHKNDTTVADMTFNGTGSTRDSWLDKSRLLSSWWSGLTPTTTTNYFSVQGAPDIYRRFFMNAFYNGCPNDEGWMMVADYIAGGAPVYGQCPYEYAHPLPAVLYSPLGGPAVWSTQIASADVMLVSVKFDY